MSQSVFIVGFRTQVYSNHIEFTHARLVRQNSDYLVEIGRKDSFGEIGWVYYSGVMSLSNPTLVHDLIDALAKKAGV